MAKKGWFGEKQRHALAAKGIKTSMNRSVYKKRSPSNQEISSYSDRPIEYHILPDTGEFTPCRFLGQDVVDNKYDAFGEKHNIITSDYYYIDNGPAKGKFMVREQSKEGSFWTPPNNRYCSHWVIPFDRLKEKPVRDEEW